MSKIGGYQIIDLGGFNFTVGSNLMTEEVRKIRETTKSILVTGIRINGEVKNDVYVDVMREGSSRCFYMYNLYFLIHEASIGGDTYISCEERLKFGTGVVRVSSDNTAFNPTDEFSIPFIDYDSGSSYCEYDPMVEDIENNPNFIIIMERTLANNISISTVFRLLSINGTGNNKTYIFEGFEYYAAGPNIISNKYHLYIRPVAMSTYEFIVAPITG